MDTRQGSGGLALADGGSDGFDDDGVVHDVPPWL
jgi:hypothetical protein